MTESAPSSSGVRCCFCGGEIATGPGAYRAGEAARMGFLDFVPGDGAAAFGGREQEFYCHAACFRSRLHDPAALRAPEEVPEADDEDAVLDACAELTRSLFLRPDALPFLERLFSQEPGRWLSVAKLCAGIDFAERRLAEIVARDTNVTLFVQHAPHPLDDAGEYSLIVFSVPYYLWSTTVIQAREM